ncbi:MAG: hypothetical protein ACW98G_08680 [Candidatus Hodarchaeales archaeon]
MSSFKLIWLQTKYTYLLILFVGVAGSWLCYFTYPGEEGVRGFLGMEDTPFMEIFFGGILDSLNSGDPGLYLYFVLLYFMAYAAILFPFIGLWLGGAGISEEMQSSMSDIFFVSPQKRQTLLYRHLISHGILLTLVVCILYFQVYLFFKLTGSSFNYPRIGNAFFLLWIATIFFFSVSFFFSTVSVRSDIGRGVAGLVLLGGYVIQMLMSFNPSLDNLRYLNPLYYTDTTSSLLSGEQLSIEIVIPIIASLSLLLLTIIIFRKRDPLPFNFHFKIFTKSKRRNDEQTKSKTKNGVIYTIQKRISPITAEQWAADKLIFLIFFAFSAFSILSIIGGFPQGEEGIDQLVTLYQNNPIAKSIMRDHNDLITSDPLGAIYPQFYGYSWIYFFFLVIIAAGRIIMRDLDTNTLDLLKGNPITAKKMIFYRMVSIVLQISFLATFMVISLILGEFFLGIQSKILEQLIAILMIVFTYLSLLSCMIAIGIVIPKPRFRKPMIYGFAGLTIISSMLPYFSKEMNPLQYFSLLYYFDLVGLIAYSYDFQYLRLMLILVIVFLISVLYIWNQSEKISYI